MLIYFANKAASLYYCVSNLSYNARFGLLELINNSWALSYDKLSNKHI